MPINVVDGNNPEKRAQKYAGDFWFIIIGTEPKKNASTILVKLYALQLTVISYHWPCIFFPFFSREKAEANDEEEEEEEEDKEDEQVFLRA